MKVSQNYKEILRKRYRFSKTSWVSSDGNTYIGYNHTLKKGEVFLKNISKKEAKILFNRDIDTIERFLNRNLKRRIWQKHFDIMVSLCYDVGTKAVKNSLFFNYYICGNLEEAFSTYLNWAKVRGEFHTTLYNRRKEELTYVQYVDKE